MADRVPIATIPGLVSPWLNTDLMLIPAYVSYTVTRVFLRRSDVVSGTVTASVRNATAGGGSGIAVSMTGTTTTGTATGSLSVTAAQALYLRVSAADAASMNLSGWVEIEGAAGVTTALTNLARVKQYLGISASTYDDLLNTLIAAVSDEIQSWLRRRILQATVSAERHDTNGSDSVYADHFPIITLSAVTEDGTALVDGTDFEASAGDKEVGRVVRLSGGDPCAWAKGYRNVRLTYDHGYATVPEAIAHAATELVAWDFKQTHPGGFGLGQKTNVLDTGGEAAFLSRDEVWRQQTRRLVPYRRLL